MNRRRHAVPENRVSREVADRNCLISILLQPRRISTSDWVLGAPKYLLNSRCVPVALTDADSPACCCLATLAWLAGAVARSHRCCCGALASLLPCRSCVTAAMRSLHRGCRAALAHHCCRPCRSRITAAVALSRRCRRVALAFLSARAPADTVSLIDAKPRTRRHAG